MGDHGGSFGVTSVINSGCFTEKYEKKEDGSYEIRQWSELNDSNCPGYWGVDSQIIHNISLIDNEIIADLFDVYRYKENSVNDFKVEVVTKEGEEFIGVFRSFAMGYFYIECSEGVNIRFSLKDAVQSIDIKESRSRGEGGIFGGGDRPTKSK